MTPLLPLYQRLADDIAGQIAAGTLRHGDRLPSLRELRARRQVSLSTGQPAFRLLEDRGLIEARPQSGFYVRPRRPTPPSPPALPVPVPVTVDPLLWQYVQVHTQEADCGMGGFRSATPSAAHLPLAAISRLMSDTVRRQPELLADYGHPAGAIELRRQIARQAMEWGGRFAVDDIVVTHGALEALNLCLRALTRPGDVVAIESPAYYTLLRCLETLGLQALEIPTDPQTGISLDALEQATRNGAVQAVVLVPNFSNPLGSLMPDEAKARLASLLAARDIPLIEDDIYGEFHFGPRRPRPVKAFDTAGNVLYCASLTKNVAPGLRVGWVEAGRFRASVELQKYIGTHSTSRLSQVVLARFLENGGYARHMRAFRRALVSQMRMLTAAVREHFPAGTRISEPQGGFVLWLALPEPFDSVELFHAAIAEGIDFAPGPLFSPCGGFRNCLRLSGAAPWNAGQAARLARLGELARRQRQG